MVGGTSRCRHFSDKRGKHELDVLAVLSSVFSQWLTSRQIVQRVKVCVDSYGELVDQAAKIASAEQFQCDHVKLAAAGIVIKSRQLEYLSKPEGQGFAFYCLQLGNESRIRLMLEPGDMPVLAATNYLVRSMSISSEPDQPQLAQHAPRITSRVPQTPIPGPGLDSTASGSSTQPVPDSLVKVIDSRRSTATVDVDGEHLNVAYTDSDDLVMFVLKHPDATIVSPQEAVGAYHRHLHTASRFILANESASPVNASVASPSISRDVREPGDSESIKVQNKKNGPAFQTGSEVDHRLRLTLFLSAHLGEGFSMSELAERFIGKPKNDGELKKSVNIIHKDINTLTTVSDDGEMVGSQFFDIDWPLLGVEGIVSAINSSGLERLVGISPQYLSILTASVSYLAHLSLLPDRQRGQVESLYERLRRHVSLGQVPWLSSTGYELEPRSPSIAKRAINTDSLLDMEHSNGTGSTRRKLVTPARILTDEGVYYAAVYMDVDSVVPKNKKAYASKDKTVDRANGKPCIWQVPRLARIEKAELVKPTKQINIPNILVSELCKWSFDNDIDAVFIIDQRDLAFIKTLPDATVEQYGTGEKVHLTVSSDSQFAAFCIAHTRHIMAVAPETLRTMIVVRAECELSISESG